MSNTAILHIALKNFKFSYPGENIDSYMTNEVITRAQKRGFLSNPYPKHYGYDRRIMLSAEYKEHETVYRVCFLHSCLAWKQTRVYEITSLQYARLLAKLGKTNNTFVSLPQEDIWGDRSVGWYQRDYIR